MQHVKTPIKMAEIGGTGRGTLFDAEGEMVIIGINAKYGQEIAQAVNAYDALVAERDELKAQRDALVEVCEMTGVYLGLWPPAAKSMQARHYAELSKKTTDTLALVEASR